MFQRKKDVVVCTHYIYDKLFIVQKSLKENWNPPKKHFSIEPAYEQMSVVNAIHCPIEGNLVATLLIISHSGLLMCIPGCGLSWKQQ